MGKTPPRRSLRQGPILRTEIDDHIEKNDDTMGVYCFGYMHEEGNLVPKYVGRSDSHNDGLNGRIHDYDGDPPKHPKLPWLRYEVCESLRATFDLECTLYHHWNKQLVNKNHPPRPEGEVWPCPVGGDECFTESS